MPGFSLGKGLKWGSAMFVIAFGTFSLFFNSIIHYRYYIFGQLLSHASNTQIDKALSASNMTEMAFRSSIIVAIAGIVGAFSRLLPADK